MECGFCCKSGLLDLEYVFSTISWWRHQIATFSALLALCVGNSAVTGEFPSHRPVMRGFDVFFDLHLNKRLSKQWRGWWFETQSHPLWHHCNVFAVYWSNSNNTNFHSDWWMWVVSSKCIMPCIIIQFLKSFLPRAGSAIIKVTA